MSKHTQGPWVVLGDNVGCATGHISFTSCNPRSIDETRADGESWLEMRDRTKADREALAKEVTANARLIAAAPELLEALKRIAERCPTDEGSYLVASVGDTARAAIAKATGETT